MAALGILKEYAKKSIPSPALPPSILFAHTEHTLTIFDAYPKVSFVYWQLVGSELDTHLTFRLCFIF